MIEEYVSNNRAKKKFSNTALNQLHHGLSSSSQQPGDYSRSLYAGHYLDKVITPIYNILAKSMKSNDVNWKNGVRPRPNGKKIQQEAEDFRRLTCLVVDRPTRNWKKSLWRRRRKSRREEEDFRRFPCLVGVVVDRRPR